MTAVLLPWGIGFRTSTVVRMSPVRAREAALPRMLVCMRVLCLHVFVTV